MGQAFAESLVMALGVAVSPVAISVALLIVTTPGARKNGPSFLAGWLFGLGLVGAGALVAMRAGAASHSEAPASWVSWLKVCVGALFLLVVLFELLFRSKTMEPNTRSSLANRLDNVRPSVACGLGVLLAGARPKNILLILGGAAVIAGSGISAWDQAITYAVFAAVATIGVALPVAIYFITGDKAPLMLRQLEDWITKNNLRIIVTLGVVIGVYLICVGISELT